MIPSAIRKSIGRATFLLLLFFTLQFCFGPSLFSQGIGSLRGFVSDSANGEALSFATVYLENSGIGANVNLRGYFFLPAVPVGRNTMVVSLVGYRTKRILVEIAENQITQENVSLAPVNIELEEVVVQEQMLQADRQMGLQAISARQIGDAPRGIEPDVMRISQRSAGVGMTGDVTTRYYVRGGGSDQNLILLNGATVYNPFHALGVFSVIDPEMISAAEFYRGGFGAQYGGRLSSMLSVVSRQGNTNRLSALAEVSLLSGKLAVEGPVPDGSFLVTGRKSYYSGVLGRYFGGRAYPFDFYDLSFSATYANPNLDKNGKLKIHGFLSGDRVDYDDPLQEDYDTRNNIIGVQWSKVWSSPLYSTFSLSYSGFTAVVEPNQTQAKERNNAVTDVSIGMDFGYAYGSRDEVAFGLQAKSLRTPLSLYNLYGVRSSYDKKGWELDGYVDYRFNRWESFTLTLGLRTKFLAVAENRPMFFEPRLTAAYRFSPLFMVKASFGRYSQEMVTLVDESELISVFEPWVIVPDYLIPPEATSYSIGATASLTEFLLIDIEGYYRSIVDLLDANPRKFSASARDFTQVDSKAYGVEATLTHNSRRFYVQASYALSWAFKLSEGQRLYTRYDARHTANLLVAVELAEGWRASLSGSLRSGMPFAPIAGFYDRLDYQQQSGSVVGNSYTPVVFWGDKNSARLPVYHRLDMSVARTFTIAPVTITAEASIINVYDRKNIYYFDRDTGQEVDMLRFSPFVSLRIEL